MLAASLVCPVAMGQTVPKFEGSIERLDPGLDALLAKDAKIEVLASGFNWSEGPVWMDGAVVFSDVPENTAFRWKEGMTAAEVFLKPSGGSNPGDQGSNGLAVDPEGHLVLCQQGERRIARREKDGSFTSLADNFDGKKFNSPNDLVISKNGTVYFTDPPYGMKDKSKRELDFDGIYGVDPSVPGKVFAVDTNIKFPNGIALSPDESLLYVAVSDPASTRILSYRYVGIGAVVDGHPLPKFGEARVVFDATSLKSPERKGLCDGMKVDEQGNIWTTGPGGVLILTKDGKHLGTILTGQATGNCAWGDDGKTLYITADMFLLRVKTLVKGHL